MSSAEYVSNFLSPLMSFDDLLWRKLLNSDHREAVSLGALWDLHL